MPDHRLLKRLQLADPACIPLIPTQDNTFIGERIDLLEPRGSRRILWRRLKAGGERWYGERRQQHAQEHKIEHTIETYALPDSNLGRCRFGCCIGIGLGGEALE